jgi:hypothetical protein
VSAQTTQQLEVTRILLTQFNIQKSTYKGREFAYNVTEICRVLGSFTWYSSFATLHLSIHFAVSSAVRGWRWQKVVWIALGEAAVSHDISSGV